MRSQSMWTEGDLLWIAAPSLTYPFVHHMAAEARPVRLATFRSFSKLLGISRAHFGVNFAYDSSQTVFVWSSTNQFRPLARLHNSANSGRYTYRARRQSGFSTTLEERSASLARTFLGEHFHVDSEVVRQQLRAALVSIAFSLDFIHHLKPRQLVVSTQHHPLQRALTLVARSSGLPTTYIPHAPTADNVQYKDLPFDRALLRGRGDYDLYSMWGARADQMSVTGDPSFDLDSNYIPDGVEPKRQIAVAPSPWATNHLKWFFTCIHAAGITDYVLLPHSASNASEIDALRSPQSVNVPNTRTVEFLKKHPVAVIQSSSGVALEAMALGRPVIELRPREMQRNYAFANTPLIHEATDTMALRRAISRALSQPNPDQTLMEYANRWVSPVGLASVNSLLDALASPVSGPEWVLDSWSMQIDRSTLKKPIRI